MKAIALVVLILFASCSSRSHIATTKNVHHKTKHNGKDRSKWEHHVTGKDKVAFAALTVIVILLATR